jgi:hypothetical protein
MSETEYSRLAAKLDIIGEKVAIIDEKLSGYAHVQEQVTRHDKAIELIDQRCRQVQEMKKNKSVPWGNVKSGVIIGLVVGIVMLIINLVILYAK